MSRCILCKLRSSGTTPCNVVSALLERNPHPTEADVRSAVSGNLCRCGTYPKVFAATLDAASQLASKV
jgi:aerobic-type carbon monoxide dehydrogenase small subunit (CoxS/CutS family)